MSESIEAQLEAARRLLPAPPPRSRGMRLLLVWIALVAICLLGFRIFNQQLALEDEARMRAPSGARR
jgi:hypothetical protein